MGIKKNIDRLLNPKLIEEWENFKSIETFYSLGVDSTFKGVKSYCLVKTEVGIKSEIILTKSVIEKNEMHSVKSEFETEVENIAKYFNAKIVGENYGKANGK